VSEPHEDGSRRIDKWLWCARRFRTRTVASRFVAETSVRVTRSGVTSRIDRPGFQLRAGDEVSFLLGERLHVVRVLDFAERRGSPEAARNLFEDVAVPAACKTSG
jgi:ribosome-associated heat shock protein Hsp15